MFIYSEPGNNTVEMPHMGLNSNNCFGLSVHEDEVKANSDYMATKLKTAAWLYIGVDFLCLYPNLPFSTISTIPQKRLEESLLTNVEVFAINRDGENQTELVNNRQGLIQANGTALIKLTAIN